MESSVLLIYHVNFCFPLSASYFVEQIKKIWDLKWQWGRLGVYVGGADRTIGPYDVAQRSGGSVQTWRVRLIVTGVTKVINVKLIFIGLSPSRLCSNIKDELCLQLLALHEPRGICKFKSPALFLTVQKGYCSDQWENGRPCSWDTGRKNQKVLLSLESVVLGCFVGLVFLLLVLVQVVQLTEMTGIARKTLSFIKLKNWCDKWAPPCRQCFGRGLFCCRQAQWSECIWRMSSRPDYLLLGTLWVCNKRAVQDLALWIIQTGIINGLFAEICRTLCTSLAS